MEIGTNLTDHVGSPPPNRTDERAFALFYLPYAPYDYDELAATASQSTLSILKDLAQYYRLWLVIQVYFQSVVNNSD